MDLAAKIAKKLLDINAIKLSPQKPFTWASGMKSPIYCDNRISLSYPDVRDFIKIHMSELCAQFGDYDAIVGVATAGIPHGALIADHLNKPFAYVRSKAKEHGRQNLIEGELKKNSKVLVVEDLISTGMSSLRAVDSLREAGCEVVGVIAIFDYGFPKSKIAFSDSSCEYATLSNYQTLVEQALRQEYISPEEAKELREWNQDPAKWAESNT